MSGTHRMGVPGQNAGRLPGRTPLALAAIMLAVIAGCATRPEGPDTPTMQAIEDATHIIEYPSQRLVILNRIAGQEDLLPHEQIYLVNAIFMGGFSSDRAEALLLLLRNACCTEATRQHIRDKLKTARMLGRDQRRVLEALAPGEP